MARTPRGRRHTRAVWRIAWRSAAVWTGVTLAVVAAITWVAPVQLAFCVSGYWGRGESRSLVLGGVRGVYGGAYGQYRTQLEVPFRRPWYRSIVDWQNDWDGGQVLVARRVPLALALVPLGLRATRWVRRRRRRDHGLCVHCAYDLTGNASGVCPECGSKVGLRRHVPSREVRAV